MASRVFRGGSGGVDGCCCCYCCRLLLTLKQSLNPHEKDQNARPISSTCLSCFAYNVRKACAYPPRGPADSSNDSSSPSSTRSVMMTTMVMMMITRTNEPTNERAVPISDINPITQTKKKKKENKKHSKKTKREDEPARRTPLTCVCAWVAASSNGWIARRHQGA